MIFHITLAIVLTILFLAVCIFSSIAIWAGAKRSVQEIKEEEEMSDRTFGSLMCAIVVFLISIIIACFAARAWDIVFGF